MCYEGGHDACNHKKPSLATGAVDCSEKLKSHISSVSKCGFVLPEQYIR